MSEQSERQERGLIIAAKTKLTQTGDVWRVPSASGYAPFYEVDPTPEAPHCTCPTRSTDPPGVRRSVIGSSRGGLHFNRIYSPRKGADMQRSKAMTLGEGILGAAISAAAGWLAASFTKVSRRDFEKALSRLDSLEKDVVSRMTRADFDKEFSEVKTLVKDTRLEMRAEFKELKIELKTKT